MKWGGRRSRTACYFFSLRRQYAVFSDTYSGPQPEQVSRYPGIPTDQTSSQITSVCLALGHGAVQPIVVQDLKPHVTFLILTEVQPR